MSRAPILDEAWREENWACERRHTGYGDARTAVYYSFLTPTHAIAFLHPLHPDGPGAGPLALIQVRPAPSRRTPPWDTTSSPLPAPRTSEWPTTRQEQ